MTTTLAVSLAAISGEAAVETLIYVLVLGVVFGLLWWLIGYAKVPEPFNRVAHVILAIAAVVVLIGILMAIAGHPIFK